jgi:hypothetical protein
MLVLDDLVYVDGIPDLVVRDLVEQSLIEICAEEPYS